MNETVSIIVPVYNVEKYLNRCLESIVNQTYRNLEIILIDDGSTDNSPKICDEWAIEDQRIKVVHKNNEGVSWARNVGMEIASGELWMFVDSDDYLVDNAVELLYKRMLMDHSDLVVGNCTYVNERGMLIKKGYSEIADMVITPQEAFRYLGTKNDICPAPWAKLYRRRVLADIHYPPISCSEDVWVLPDIFCNCEKISIMSTAVYYYVQRANSAVHTPNDNKFLEQVGAALRMVRFLRGRGLHDNARHYYATALHYAANMSNAASARRLIHGEFSLLERLRLQKRDIHSLIRLGALYSSGVREILRKRRARR